SHSSSTRPALIPAFQPRFPSTFFSTVSIPWGSRGSGREPEYPGARSDRSRTSLACVFAEMGKSPRSRAAARDRFTVRRASSKGRSEEHTSELQSRFDLVCRLPLEKKKSCDMEEIEWI